MADAWPTTAPAKDAVERRCAGCHGKMLPRFVTDQVPVDEYGDLEGWQRPTSRFSRHTVFNLTRPEKSLALMAPLAREAGGYASGATGTQAAVTEDRAHPPKPVAHPVIFESADDPDYQKILAHSGRQGSAARRDQTVRHARLQAERAVCARDETVRRAAGGFRPGEGSDRCLRDGQEYWQSLWWSPETKGSKRKAELGSHHEEAGHTGH